MDEHIWLVTFMHYDLGYFDDETCRLEPIENPFGPTVLPMSPEWTAWDWRRRPDLNRGWRFCRFPRVGYVVDPSCLLLSADPSCYPVFGR